MFGLICDFYFGGKVLELVVFSVQFFFGEGCFVEELCIICLEVECIYVVCDLLVGVLQELLLLDMLVSCVGMNLCKLIVGFCKVFGVSVFGYLQEYCLCEVYWMFCDEEVNVFMVVYWVGYSLVYFFIVFCKCYGIFFSEIC